MPTSAPTHGALLTGSGQTRFSLWAPDAQAVSVELVNGDIHPLDAAAGGWFCIEIDCAAGTGYRFLINNEQAVPDPASRAQLEDLHGFSCVVDHHCYHWLCGNWQGRPWHEAIIYELHVGLLGGFKGVRNRLASLKKLGITAIELMPLGEFPGNRNWGYDGALPFAPESSYGTPDELKNLIDTAHGLGLMVYIDVVYNHFGPDGNYLDLYASSFFRSDIQTPWGSAIDFRRPEVRNFFCENALMWIFDYRVDGLRFDAAHAISDRDFLVDLAHRVRSALNPNRQVHLVLENEYNCATLLEQGFDAQWNDDGHNVLHTILTGEHEGYYTDFSTNSTAKLARCLSEGFIYQGEEDRNGMRRGESSAHLPATAFVLFLQNHDQVGNRAFGDRLHRLTSADALKCSVALMLLSPMVPLLFMGEEWGATEPFLYFTEHHEELANAVYHGRRNEFKEFAHFRGFAETVLDVPDPNALKTFLDSIPDYESASRPEHQQWHDFYSQLLALRQQHIIPRLRGTRSSGAQVLAEHAVSASWTMADRSELRISLNLSSAQVLLPDSMHSEINTGKLLFSWGLDSADTAGAADVDGENAADAEKSASLPAHLPVRLPPHSVIVSLKEAT